MTNREMFVKLSSFWMSYFIYKYITQRIGTAWTSSIHGVEKWFDNEKDEAIWKDFEKEKIEVERLRNLYK